MLRIQTSAPKAITMLKKATKFGMFVLQDKFILEVMNNVTVNRMVLKIVVLNRYIIFWIYKYLCQSTL